MTLPDGLVAVVKHDCPTCVLVEPVLRELAAQQPLHRALARTTRPSPRGSRWWTTASSRRSWRLGHRDRADPAAGRGRGRGRAAAGLVARRLGAASPASTGLGAGLPDHRPGCGSRSVEWGVEEELERRYGGRVLASRTVELADLEDEVEAAYDRGWTDGLPVVPPTEERVLRMLRGTARAPDEVVAVVPPDLVPCTVEKVAVNAVLAGCLPEHLPVVLAAVEAACTDAFNVHGLLATTYFSSPVVVVNGPVARAIGMGSGVNALGQGNRANATIGRALQLVVRNVGGGRPGEVDRADARQPRQVHVLLRRARGRLPVHPARRLARRRRLGRHPVRRRRGQPGRRPAQPRPGVAGPHASRSRCGPSATPSSATPSTRCWSSAPSTAGSCARRAGTASGCSPSSSRCCSWPPTSCGAAAAASPRACRRGSTPRRCRSSGRAGCSSRTRAATPGCSRPSSAAGSAARPAAPP